MYYFVADSQREYKEFNFGAFINKGQYDFQGVQVADKVSLSCSRYPFVSYGQSKTMTTIAGVSDHGELKVMMSDGTICLVNSGEVTVQGIY